VLLLSLPLAPSCWRHVRSASLLLRFATSEQPSGLAAVAMHPVDEEAGTLQTGSGPTRMRLYRPRGVEGAPGLVLLHGIHRLGVEEPRMKRFARAIASAGVVVLTPEITELTDYRIDRGSLATIGAAATELARRTGRASVGVLGMSFSGGLSLLAATDPATSKAISFVVSVGGHHDLARVSRFFVRDEIEAPDGTTHKLHAHDYGVLVLIYGQTSEFFSEPDAALAHEVLRLWLAEEREPARQKAEALSPAGKARMTLLFEERHGPLEADILASIARHEEAMRPVSPAGQLASLRADVFLLHGQGDTVIPSTETLWTARETPPSRLKSALVTEAVQHVELQGKPSAWQQAELVHFMALLLESAFDEPIAVR
jgi:hypothetical protein